MYSASQKNPPWGFLLTFFPGGRDFLVQILHAYYTFLSTLDYKFLFNYLQLWRSYAILSATTQFTSYAQNVHHRLNACWLTHNTFIFLFSIKEHEIITYKISIIKQQKRVNCQRIMHYSLWTVPFEVADLLLLQAARLQIRHQSNN